MKREIILTADGSHTVAVPERNVLYHSRHGAIQESVHVFIEAGLRYMWGRREQPGTMRIFEMGFGTGLNAFLTAIEAQRLQRNIHYAAIEQFPLSIDEAMHLNYAEVLQHKELFQQLQEAQWNEDAVLNKHFTLHKMKDSLFNFSASLPFNLIYYDAFAPAAQPELWTEEVFQKLFNMLEPNGVLVTYCSKGDVRRTMMAAGFSVTKLPGPKGKREMLRAARRNLP